MGLEVTYEVLFIRAASAPSQHHGELLQGYGPSEEHLHPSQSARSLLRLADGHDTPVWDFCSIRQGIRCSLG